MGYFAFCSNIFFVSKIKFLSWIKDLLHKQIPTPNNSQNTNNNISKWKKEIFKMFFFVSSFPSLLSFSLKLVTIRMTIKVPNERIWLLKLYISSLKKCVGASHAQAGHAHVYQVRNYYIYCTFLLLQLWEFLSRKSKGKQHSQWLWNNRSAI